MGRLKKQTLGKVSGRVGNVVVRDFGDEQFVSVRPDKYKIEKNFKEVGYKLHFYYSMKIAKTVIKLPGMKEVWNKSNLPGKRGYNRMIKANIALLKESLPSVDNIITPKGRALFLEITELNDNLIKFTFGMAGFIKPPFVLIYVFVFFNPIKPEYGLIQIYESISYFKQENAEKLRNKKDNSKYDFKDEIGSTQQGYLSHFQNVILYAAVVGTPTVKRKKWWSSTVAVDLRSGENNPLTPFDKGE
jgi:hypothetical protein